MFDALNDFDDRPTNQGGRYAADAGVHARFYTFPIRDEAASAEAGIAKYREVTYVEIIAAGNANNILQRKATDEDKRRFARQYEIFLRSEGNADQTIGTQLSEVSWLTRSEVEELAYLKIRTLEMLANVDDVTCGKVVGLYDKKRKAVAALEAAEKAAPITALYEENQMLKSTVEVQTGQIKELSEQLAKLADLVEKNSKPSK